MTGRKVAIYGSGRTATELVRALTHSSHAIVGSIVHSSRRAGKDLGSLTIGQEIGVVSSTDLATQVRSGTFDLLLYAGLSGKVHEEAISLCIDAGIDMVHPCFVHPEVALGPELRQRLESRAVTTGSRIVGTGVNPGLWLDVLPSLVSSALPAPVSVRARRVSDISNWGADVLRHEVGIGSARSGTVEKIDQLLRESARMIADALELTDAKAVERGGYVIAENSTRVGEVDVLAGQVQGFRQEVAVESAGVDRVRLQWHGMAGRDPEASASANMSGVEIEATGGDGSSVSMQIVPPLDPIPGTAARMVRAIAGLTVLPPGFHATTALAVA